MSTNDPVATDALVELKARMPQHVVFRDFPSETIVLNLETGKYHGLNVVAGRMLATMNAVATLGEAAKRLAAEYEQPLEVILEDIRELCAGLESRGLITLSPAR